MLFTGKEKPLTSTSLYKLLLLLILLCGIVWVLFNDPSLYLNSIENLIQNHGAAAPIVFILIYILATIFFFPGSLLTLLGGALFGPLWGVIYNLSGATIGAVIAFLTARYLAADWVAKQSAPRLKQLIHGVETEGWRFVAFTRLVPVFPFNLLNYALGLTKIKLWDYTLATGICMLPGAIAYTYLGYIGKEAATGGENLAQKILLAIALLACIAFLPRLIKHMRQNSSL